MIGGGRWKKQNKILNGAFINFVSKKPESKKKRHVSPPTVDKSAILGKAILGKLILGRKGYSLPKLNTPVITLINDSLLKLETPIITLVESSLQKLTTPVIHLETVDEPDVPDEPVLEKLNAPTIYIETDALPKLDAPVIYLEETSDLISFTIAETSYQAEDGMTWGEWVDSEYNTDGYYVSNSRIVGTSSTSRYVSGDGYNVAPTEPIHNNQDYTMMRSIDCGSVD